MHRRLGGVIRAEGYHNLQGTSLQLPANTPSPEMTVTYDSSYVQAVYFEPSTTGGGFTANLYRNGTIVATGGRPSNLTGPFSGTLTCFASKGDKIKYQANVATTLGITQEQSLSVSFI